MTESNDNSMHPLGEVLAVLAVVAVIGVFGLFAIGALRWFYMQTEAFHDVEVVCAEAAGKQVTLKSCQLQHDDLFYKEEKQ